VGGKTMKKLFILINLPVGLLLYSSCQKQVTTDPKPVPPSCKVASAYYYASPNGIYDSATFVYNGDKLAKAESDLKLITYTYNGANISSRTYFDKLANSVSFVDSAEYDASNRLKKLTVWYYPGRFSDVTKQYIYNFSYKGNNYDKITSIIKNSSNSSTPDTLQNIFQIDAVGNTQSIVTLDKEGNVYDSVHYSYDSNPNYFKKIDNNFFLFDANFQMQGSYLHHLPYSISTNNVTSFSYFANTNYQVNYQLDSLKNVTAVNVNGSPYATYSYNCHQ